MVSVNFKNSANKSAVEIAATTKPSLVIDIMASPYQVIEPSPEPIIDVYSDEEQNIQPMKDKNSLDKSQMASKDSEMPLEIAEDNVEHIESHMGPRTPPNMPEHLDLAKGPQTPTEDPMDYDPCDPTESPGDPNTDPDNEILLHSGSSSSASNHHR